MIIDVNVYFGNWPYWPLVGGDVDSLLRGMDRYDIERAFLSSLKGVFADPQTGNRETLKIVDAFPDRFAPALTYSPYTAGRGEFREELARNGWRMVKLYPLNHSFDVLEEPLVDEICGWCAVKKIPVLIPYRLMMSWRFPVYSVQKIGQLAQKHPLTPFIIGSINYLFELQSTMDVLRRCPNVYVETSAMMAFREIEKLVREFGAGRFLHGSAAPLQNQAIGPLKIKTAEIDEEDRMKILYRNAWELFQACRD